MRGVTYEGYDVVVVPFPFSDRDTTKRRPALVISATPFNRRHSHLVLAMITTAASTSWPSDTAIADLAAAGLPQPSVVRLKLFTLESAALLRRIGRLASADAKAVARALGHNLVGA